MYVNRPTKLRTRAARLFILGAVIAMAPGVVHALGLGNIRVNSALNESLNAEIDFTSISKRELKSLNVTLASRADFDSAGVEKLSYLAGIKFTLAKRLDGRSFLQLQTEQPIREPFLHFLLQVEWAGGRLVREFTALIDPPYLVAGKLPKIQVPQTPAPEPEPVMTQPAGAVVQPLTPEPALEAETQVAEMTPEPESEAIMEAVPEASGDAELIEAIEPVEPLVEALGPDMGDDSVAIEDSGPMVEEAPDVAMTESADQFVEPLPFDDTAEPTVVQPGGMMGTGPNWANIAEYEVQRGDTLWGIAQQVSIDPALTTEQVIMALYETNPDAFFRNNVNNVYAGKILRIPERETLTRLAARDARRVFLAQYSEWQDYKVQLAQASAAIEVAEPAVEESVMSQAEESAEPLVETPSEPMTEEIKVAEQPVEEAMQPEAPMQPEIQEPREPPQEEKIADSAGTAALAAKAKPPGDLLKIVRAAIKREGSEAGTVAEGEGATDTTDAEQLALAERATTLEEALESKQMEQAELSERIGTVETQIEKQKRLIEIENESLAKAQGSDTQTTPMQPADAALEKKPEEVKVAAADTKTTAEPAKSATAKTPDKKKPVLKKKRIVAPPPPPEQGIMAMIQDILGGIAGDHMTKAVGGVVALAALLVGLTYFRRRRQAEAEFEESILTDTGGATTEEMATTDSGGGESAAMATSSAGNTSFLSDFSQGGMGNISTDEVDPLAETEVYLAYGRDEQAEEILKEAVNKDPGRQELKVKLLEIYHARNDVAAFETMAEELYAAQEGRGGELWNTVAEMGRKLNPDNPMFQVVAPVAEIPTEEPTVPPGAAFEAPEPAMDFEGPEEPPTEMGFGMDMDADAGLDLNMGADEGEIDAPADTGLEFDLNMDTDAAAAPEEPVIAEEPAFSDAADDVAGMGLEDDAGVAGLDLGDAADTGADFDISEAMEEGDLAVAEDVGAAVDAATDSGDMEWDLDSDSGEEAVAEVATGAGPSTDDSQQWDETATKLDLAKAYVDMGDAEGARSILDEVLAEGNDEQKKQAAELAAQLG